jgi:3-oxoacyl-[acyl-carrier protein] reductase
MELELGGKVVLVAGASRGIGLAIAVAFAREGARVVLTARDAARLESACTDVPGERIAVAADMATTEGIQSALNRATEEWGGVDAVVANVGSGRTASAAEATREGWQHALDVNLMPAVLLAKSALPLLPAGTGSFTAISSITGREALDAPVTYTAAKAALNAAMKSLARTAGQDGVRVNAVAPGNVLFPGGDWQERLDRHGDETRRYIDEQVPLQRFGRPEEIADAVVYLASARAAFVTGAVLVVDGGQTRGW